MAEEIYYQFPLTPGQSRRAGKRGGQATARNRRERLHSAAAAVLDSDPVAVAQVALETTAAAIALLDAQYPWLYGAERRGSRTLRRAAGLTAVPLC